MGGRTGVVAPASSHMNKNKVEPVACESANANGCFFVSLPLCLTSQKMMKMWSKLGANDSWQTTPPLDLEPFTSLLLSLHSYSFLHTFSLSVLGSK